MTVSPNDAPSSEVDLLVIGGGPGGLAAVTAYRAAGGGGVVVLATSEADLPYDRTSLSKSFLRGEDDQAALSLANPEFYAEQSIDVRTGRTAPPLTRAARQSSRSATSDRSDDSRSAARARAAARSGSGSSTTSR